MIITVTLNTAIDKTLAVPNFRLGRRHRTVRESHCDMTAVAVRLRARVTAAAQGHPGLPLLHLVVRAHQLELAAEVQRAVRAHQHAVLDVRLFGGPAVEPLVVQRAGRRVAVQRDVPVVRVQHLPAAR